MTRADKVILGSALPALAIIVLITAGVVNATQNEVSATKDIPVYDIARGTQDHYELRRFSDRWALTTTKCDILARSGDKAVLYKDSIFFLDRREVCSILQVKKR